tara:strand:- start:91 stop:711 length:621 start_codon:yes stop_codon:yes gene_type:complete
VIKKYLIILTILCLSSVHAQYDNWTPAKVILKNGKSFRGWVKFPKHSGGLISIGSTGFKYRKKKKGKTEKYGSDNVDEVIFGDEEFTTLHYKYVPIKKKKSVLMELAVRGKANLYTRTVLKRNSIFTGNPNFPSTTTYYDDTQYYIIRNEEQKATLIAGPNSFGGFISKAKKYFSDCSKIVDYLENELYELNNIEELVDDYNLLCE